MPIRKDFVMTLGGVRHVVKLPTYYDQINSQLRITEASDADRNLPRIREPLNLLADGRAVKVRTRRKASNTNKYYTTDFIISVDSLNAAMADLEGKTFATKPTTTGEIISAYFPRKRRLG